MPKLAPLDWKRLVRVFEADGFTIDHHHGSHIVMVKNGVPRPVVIPKRKDVARFIIANNMRTAGMTKERFFELLDG